MSLTNEPGAESAPEPTTIVTVPGTDNFHSPSSAARALANHRYAQRQETEQPKEPAESAQEATPEPVDESAQADAAPPEEVTGETQDADPVAELPPIEPPRSWSKEKRENWSKLDRDLQEYLVEHDRETSTSVRRAQNEAAEQRKALDADRAKVDQARQQYESALPILLQSLSASYSAEFSDIQTIDDVQRLANDDPLRYTRWDAQQKRLAGVQQEINAAQQRQVTERQQKLSEFMKRESELFTEKVPEFADEAQRTKLQNSAVSVLKDLGFKDEELASYWNGDRDISIHDHRLHLLLRESVQFREMKKNAKTVIAVQKPPVQRPGAARPKGADADAKLQALTQKLDQSSGVNALRAGAAILAERRKAAR